MTLSQAWTLFVLALDVAVVLWVMFVVIPRRVRSWQAAEASMRTWHLSDYAVHNEPALPAGPCDCGLTDAAEGHAHSARADADGISLEQQAAHEALLVGDAALLDA